MAKKKTGRHRLTIRIPEHLFEWLEKKAEQRDVSANRVILECIERNLDSEIIARKAMEISEKRTGRILTK